MKLAIKEGLIRTELIQSPNLLSPFEEFLESYNQAISGSGSVNIENNDAGLVNESKNEYDTQMLRDNPRDALEQQLVLLKVKFEPILGPEAIREVFARHASAEGESALGPGTAAAAAALATDPTLETTVFSEEPSAVTARHPLAITLESTSLEQRRAALDEHYAARKQNTWTQAKSDKPKPEEFLAWLDAVFPDRREIGMVLSDLKYLDKSGYDKVMNWSSNNSSVSRATIDAFGLPTKITRYDPARDANAPKSVAEILARAERGEANIKNLQRDYRRARYHRRLG